MGFELTCVLVKPSGPLPTQPAMALFVYDVIEPLLTPGEPAPKDAFGSL